MGSGSSVPLEQRMTADAPVELPPVQTDGSAGHRDETMTGGSPTYYRRGYSSASGIMQMYSQSESDRADSLEQFKQRRATLEIQASSNWHRILEHAKDQMDQGKFEKPRCPECSRGRHTTPTCRLCGADVSQAQRDTSVESPGAGSSGDSPGAGSLSSFKYSPIIPQLQWNPETKTYDRITVQQQAEEEALQAMLAEAESKPRDDYRADPKTSSPGHRGSVVGDQDHDFLEMNKLIGIMRGNGEKEEEMRRKRLGTGGVSSLTIAGAKAMQEELDALAQEQARALSDAKISEKVRRIQERKLKAERENLLLTLRGIINNSIDFEKKKKRRRLRREERKKNPGSPPAPSSDSDSDSIGDSDEDLDDDDFDDEDFAFDEPPPPDFEMPAISIELRSRTSNSLSVQWDANPEGARFIDRLHTAYGGNKIPLYECSYKIHNDGTDAWLKAGKKGSKRQLTIEGLVPNTPYVLRARRVGWGEWGEGVVIRTGPGVPSQPKALSAREVTSSSILVTWQAPDKDNGLPVTEYSVLCKAYGGSFAEVYTGRDRVLLHTSLPHNVVHIYEVRARNKLGLGESSLRLAVRTLPQGAADMTPWAEAIDDRSCKLFYRHPRSSETSWVLPKGALLDEAASLRNKRSFLTKRVVARAQDACLEMGVHAYVISLQLRRQNILEESLQRVYALSKNAIDAGPIRIKFEEEDGLDAGGLAKDWFNQVSRSLVEGSTGLLQVSSEGEANIDTRAGLIHKPSESRWLFKALGIFVAKAIIDSQSLGIMFNSMILLHMAGKTPALSDLADIDGSFYKGLKWVEDNDVTGADLTFSASYELFGENQMHDLVEGGRDVEVTQENKEEYVELMVQWLTRQRYEPCLGHFLEGFHRHIPRKDLQHFRREELRIMIAGQVTIDARDVMREATFSGGFDSSSDQVQWLRDLLDRSDQQTLSRFLRFVTGCQCMPVEGLNPPLMLTHTEGTDDTLPRAHTCFNQLVLPMYSAMEVLEAKLVFALENAQEGFFLS